jgi:hypothetical protein
MLNAAGINAASITYDSREILAAFGEAYKIGFPLLSDAGSKVIRAFGILNTNIPEDHKMMYGMAFPGDYLLAPDGTVRDKLFLPSYEHRPSASALALRNTDGAFAGNSVEIDAGVFRATVTLSADRCFPGQELATALSIRLNSGWHIYGTPLPANYRPTELVFESPIVGEQSIELPAAKPMRLEALGETLPVYEGEVRATGRLGIKWSPPMPAKFLEPFGKPIAPGRYKIAGTLRFQACSDSVCEPPQAMKFELPLELEAGIPPTPKKPA